MSVTPPKLINLKGTLRDLSQEPLVMGILNVTPDSFFSPSRKQTLEEIEQRTDEILSQGAQIIDVGAYSSRPGAEDISEKEEIERLRPALELIRRKYPRAIVSIDTFRSRVAQVCVEEWGADIINDISAGDLDPDMFSTIARLRVPYIIMHMQGTPGTMQEAPRYKGNIVQEVLLYLEQKIQKLQALGVNDIIVDPGFGFGKTLEHNYQLLDGLQEFALLQRPLLVGVSRKSMIYRLLDTTPAHALNGTTAIHAISLMKGASILRAHDVREAVETVRIYQKMKQCASPAEATGEAIQP